ncbi:PAS domain-containing protein, partial [Microbispora sp. H10830]|uniref:PAS domain-containing protein n=1 Tax=Microbispora sp. H10830 TaxID=2729109 RepID=UPI002175E775
MDISDSDLFRGLMSEAPFAFAFFNPDGRFVRVNSTFTELTGHPVELHLDRQPAELLPADLTTLIEAALRRIADEALPVTDQRIRTRAENGDSRHWTVSFFPMRDDDGVVGTALFGVDVTERQLNEEMLERSEERYRSLVESQQQLVWISSPSGSVAEDAPQWRAITGQGLEEYLAHGWLDAVHPDDRPGTEEAWREALRGRTMFEWSYRVRTRASGYRHFEVRAVPIIRHGRVVEWVGANTDVTPQREAEEMRGRLTDQLGAAALRTARLQGATAQLAEALTVEQVVQVIIDVGR